MPGTIRYVRPLPPETLMRHVRRWRLGRLRLRAGLVACLLITDDLNSSDIPSSKQPIHVSGSDPTNNY